MKGGFEWSPKIGAGLYSRRVYHLWFRFHDGTQQKKRPEVIKKKGIELAAFVVRGEEKGRPWKTG